MNTSAGGTGNAASAYWDELAARYQTETRISTRDFHYGPLLPGESRLGLLQIDPQGADCLELGCGAAQNSLYLARRGANCTALDFSEQQLAFARKLADREAVHLNLLLADVDHLPGLPGPFSLIHSAYGIPFASDPAALIRRCAGLLCPGGQLLFSMGHPVYSGEWLELDDEQGIFLHNYFHPQPDVRESEEAAAQARCFPLSEVTGWLLDAGLELLDLREPSALPVDRMTAEEIDAQVPYYSEDWAEQVNELSRFPIVAIFSARKPLTSTPS